MKKYLHLYLTLMKLNFSTLFAYRANFINSVISSIGWGIVSLLSMFILTAKTSTIYGWNRNELLLLTGVYSISIGIFHTIFSRNFDKFATIIHRGELDSVLLKPIDSQFLVSFTYFNFLGIARTVIGVVFSYTILLIMQIEISVSLGIYFFIFLAFGILLMYTVWFGVIVTTMWASNLDNLKDFLYQFNNLGRYPSDMLYKTNNIFLFLLVPLTYVASIPVKQLLNKVNSSEVIVMIVVCGILFFASRKFWHYALRFYTSANI